MQPAHAQDSVRTAPPINFSTCLNHPKLSRKFFKNKYVVLDFWATWCGPCIASFPHLDSLSRKFSSDSVVFAIMSSEAKGKVAKFLAKRNIKAYELIDSVTAASRASVTFNDLYGITAQSFGVVGLPHTVIIDKNNQIVFTSELSRDLTAYDLEQIIHGHAKAVMERRDILKNNSLSGVQRRAAIFKTIAKDTIKAENCTLITATLPYTDYNMSTGKNNNKQTRFIEVLGRPFDFYYNYFTEIPETRFIDKSGLNSIYVKIEGDKDVTNEVFYKAAIDLLRTTYHLKFVKKQKLVDTYELKVVDLSKFKLKSKPLQDASSYHRSFDATDKQLVFSNFTFEDIGKGLEDYLQIPILVMDNNLLKTKCDMTIGKGDFAHLNKFLSSHYGVILKKAKHMVEFTEIVDAKS